MLEYAKERGVREDEWQRIGVRELEILVEGALHGKKIGPSRRPRTIDDRLRSRLKKTGSLKDAAVRIERWL